MADLTASGSTPTVTWDDTDSPSVDWRMISGAGPIGVEGNVLGSGWDQVFVFEAYSAGQHTSKRDLAINTSAPALIFDDGGGTSQTITSNGSKLDVDDGGTNVFTFDGAGNTCDVDLNMAGSANINWSDGGVFTKKLSPRGYARIQSSGTATYSVGLSGASKTSTGVYTLTWNETFTTYGPMHVAVVDSSSALFCIVEAPATSRSRVRIFDTSGTPTNSAFTIICFGDLKP